MLQCAKFKVRSHTGHAALLVHLRNGLQWEEIESRGRWQELSGVCIEEELMVLSGAAKSTGVICVR